MTFPGMNEVPCATCTRPWFDHDPWQHQWVKPEPTVDVGKLKHCVVVKHVATGYVTLNWKYDDPEWARWKVAEMTYHDRRNGEFAFAIVSI